VIVELSQLGLVAGVSGVSYIVEMCLPINIHSLATVHSSSSGFCGRKLSVETSSVLKK